MNVPRGVAVACYVAWLAMWADISVPNILSGIVAVAVVLWVSSALPTSAVRHRLHPIALARLFGHFVRLLVLSNWTLVKTSLHPTPTALRSAIVAAPLSQRSPLVSTIVANFISLTPGTLTLDVRLDEPDDPVLYLHVLGFTDVEAARADVAEVERWVLAAVTPRTRTDIADGPHRATVEGAIP